MKGRITMNIIDGKAISKQIRALSTDVFMGGLV